MIPAAINEITDVLEGKEGNSDGGDQSFRCLGQVKKLRKNHSEIFIDQQEGKIACNADNHGSLLEFLRTDEKTQYKGDQCGCQQQDHSGKTAECVEYKP